MKITSASDGIRGLINATQSNYDLIVIDFRMPKMDGVELIENLRNLKISRNQQTPIVMISGFLPEANEKMEDGNQVKMMEKPFDSDRLFKKIDDILQ